MRIVILSGLLLALVAGIVYFAIWADTRTHEWEDAPVQDAERLYCLEQLSSKMGQPIAWNTTLHPARVWLKLCWKAQLYDPSWGDMSKEAVLFYDGTADRIFATYLAPKVGQ